MGDAAPATASKHIALVGLMGVGKTSVGRRLAETLSMPFVDSDHAIEDAAGMSIADLFETYGEPEFRKLERRVIARLMAREPSIIALGGGAFVDQETRDLVLDGALVVWLDADIDVLVERTSRKPGKRPLLAQGDPREILSKLLAVREPFYGKAHVKVRTGPEPVGDVVNRLCAKLTEIEASRGP